MRLAVFADIHGNLEALEAFLDHVSMQQVDRYVCLGDLVGYGADPGECIEKVRALPMINVVLGNHDAAAVWLSSPYAMSKIATKAILWTMDQLAEDHGTFLKELKETLTMGDMIFSHANPYNPGAWRYVTTRKYAGRCFSGTREKLLFVGHTHEPMVITKRNPVKIVFEPPGQKGPIPVDRKKRQIFNCGSIGQPRDGNPQASYLIYDTRHEEMTFHRVSYDCARAAEKIRRAGLPVYLADRLMRGR
ncbi:MAG: metallophosphoesterase family protein [bacterium]|nr:metallophosphoesterase family protein [bacterium]